MFRIIVLIFAGVLVTFCVHSQEHSSAIVALDYDPVINLIATGHEDRTVRLWDASTDALITTLPAPNYAWMDGEVPYAITDMDFQSDGSQLAVSYGGLYEIGLIQIWDVTSHILEHELEIHHTTGALSWNTDGRLLAITSADSRNYYLSIWDGQRLEEIGLETSALLTVAWSPDGNYLALPASDNTIILLNTVDWTVAQTLTGHQALVTDLAWSPDGSKLASTDDFTIHIWNHRDGQHLDTFDHSTSDQFRDFIIWNPVGTHIAITTGSFIEIWDVRSSQPTLVTEVNDTVSGFVWTDEDRILYSTFTRSCPLVLDTPSQFPCE